MIKIKIDVAKEIAHNKRRAERRKLFAPLDDAIAKQIPGIDAVEIEKKRQQIRDNDKKKQKLIDSAKNESEILKALYASPK